MQKFLYCYIPAAHFFRSILDVHNNINYCVLLDWTGISSLKGKSTHKQILRIYIHQVGPQASNPEASDPQPHFICSLAHCTYRAPHTETAVHPTRGVSSCLHVQYSQYIPSKGLGLSSFNTYSFLTGGSGDSTTTQESLLFSSTAPFSAIPPQPRKKL